MPQTAFATMFLIGMQPSKPRLDKLRDLISHAKNGMAGQMSLPVRRPAGLLAVRAAP